MTEYQIEVDDMGLGLMRSDPFYKSIEVVKEKAYRHNAEALFSKSC
jgi:hypothetical protein